jgi:hypothetical protein
VRQASSWNRSPLPLSQKSRFLRHLDPRAARTLIAAGVLYPVFGWLLPPAVAAATTMALSSVSVVGNALRLRGARL